MHPRAAGTGFEARSLEFPSRLHYRAQPTSFPSCALALTLENHWPVKVWQKYGHGALKILRTELSWNSPHSRSSCCWLHLFVSLSEPCSCVLYWPQGLLSFHFKEGLVCPPPYPFLSLLLCFVEQGLDHIAENILSYLDARSLCAAELVCKEWQRVISEGMLWKKLIERMVRTDPLWKGLSERRGW